MSQDLERLAADLRAQLLGPLDLRERADVQARLRAVESQLSPSAAVQFSPPAECVAWQLDESSDGENWTAANAGPAGSPVRAKFKPESRWKRTVWVERGGNPVVGPKERI